MCCVGVDASFMTGLFFPFLLIISATLYAFKTRKCPGGFNETRFILFTNCINTIHWLAFVPLYLVSTDHKIRAVILAYSLSLSGIVQLGCLIFPKLYTVLFKPEKNTKCAVMNQHRSHSYMTHTNTPPNSFKKRYIEHRNSTPAILLKMDLPSGLENCTSRTSLDSLTSLTPKIRHPTWSHSQHKDHRCLLKSEQFRTRSRSVSRSTQTRSSTCEDDQDDGLVIGQSFKAEQNIPIYIDDQDDGLTVRIDDQDDGFALNVDDGLMSKIDSCVKNVEKKMTEAETEKIVT